jgi:very-short-patch-repair endonuclease
LLWRELRNRQLARWKFRRQHPIDRYIVDFVTLAGKVIAEVDGRRIAPMGNALTTTAALRHSNSWAFTWCE